MSTLSQRSSGQSTGDTHPYNCSADCGKRFTVPRNQQRHEQFSCKLSRQQNRLPFWCICDRTYVRMDALWEHMCKEHKELNERMYAVHKELVADWKAAQDFINTFPHESGTAPAIKERYTKPDWMELEKSFETLAKEIKAVNLPRTSTCRDK